ncbi:hypothetical protein FGG08_002562 [Glutinoglossum americanum]|uniref:Phosducin domain-containing protein n=1 Tax=Glutinoglossum americanum TaxID=1670608 RepID=A0A9P8I8Y8_9PEZI|nr:hypothetical protein FGG08_002562 [Glutinoglossum americanum]
MDMPVNVPVDNPNADTEWNDILRKHGIIPEKPPSPTPIIEEAILEGRRLAHENRLEGKDLDELDGLEDEEDEEFLEKYRYVSSFDRAYIMYLMVHRFRRRKQRLAELSTITKASLYGQVYPLQKPDYSRDVTEASKSSFVLVHLTSSLGTNIESRLLTELWRDLARKFGDIKFCEIRGDLCIEGYPEKNCPTILAYHNGDILRQIITLKQFRGQQTSIDDIARLLVDVGAVKPNDYRILRTQDHSAHRRPDNEDDDDDWDD